MAAYKLLGKAYQSYQARGLTYTADQYGVVSVASPTQQDILDLINDGLFPLGQIGGLNNVAAIMDPAASNDNTQDYAAGSLWVNTTNGRVWICQSAVTGAAAWALAVVPGTGVEPSSNLEQFGSGIATVLAEGNVFRYASGSGTVPAVIGTDNVLAVYSMPANSFDGTGNRGISVMASGSFANNPNSKRVKLIFNASAAVVGGTVTGGVTIADSGINTTAGGIGWNLSANIFKYGAANSNTQLAQATGIIAGSTHGGINAPILTTATENAPILIAVTGNAVTTASDIVLNFVEINAMN